MSRWCITLLLSLIHRSVLSSYLPSSALFSARIRFYFRQVNDLNRRRKSAIYPFKGREGRSLAHSLAMPPRLTIPTRDSQLIRDDPVEAATGRRSSSLRPTSWIIHQHEKQRSQELQRAWKEQEERQNGGKEVQSETPMIEWTGAFFRRLFRRGYRQ